MPPPPACTSISISLSFEFAGAQLLSEAFARRRAGAGADQRVEDALFGRLFGARLHVFAFSFAHERDADLDQIAHDLFDIAADIADLGKFGGLDLQERRAGEPGQPAGNLGLADAGRADHQNVFRQHFLAQFVVELQPPPAVAQRNRDCTLGVALADDDSGRVRKRFRGGRSRS